MDLGKSPIPLGTQQTGEAHSHPEDGGFSGQDVQRAHDLTLPHYGHPEFGGIYVGRPDGTVIKYDDKTGNQQTFGIGEPQ